MKKVAVILCGSGFKDGSEIRESVAVLYGLSLKKAEVQCFAPDSNQYEVVNCLTFETAVGESRNMLVESARIARGQVKALSQLNVKDFDAVILPGGFGAAKNLCNFAFKGSKAEIDPDLAKKLVDFNESKKPIGAVCIAPAIVALAFKGKNFELTLGESGETSQELEKLGHKHIIKKVTECLVDSKNKVVTTPAYMYDKAELCDVFAGIQSLVNEVLNIA